jgi:hypothetical protein
MRQRPAQLGHLRTVAVQRSQPLQQQLGAIDAPLFQTGLNLLAGELADSTEQFTCPTVPRLDDTGGTDEIHRRDDITSLQRLLGFGDRIFGVQPGGG